MSSDKWIRSIKDNPAGKVVADDNGTRWQWEDADETARLLRKLNNDELAIEQTDIVANAATGGHPLKPAAKRLRGQKVGTDSGGGFNPYDHSGKPRR